MMVGSESAASMVCIPSCTNCILDLLFIPISVIPAELDFCRLDCTSRQVISADIFNSSWETQSLGEYGISCPYPTSGTGLIKHPACVEEDEWDTTDGLSHHVQARRSDASFA